VHLVGGSATAGADVGFVRITAGTTFPPHRHLGEEHVLVLQGSYQDSDGTDRPRRRPRRHGPPAARTT
jgi:anti-sigma factor ChrR (cupin superfamily)